MSLGWRRLAAAAALLLQLAVLYLPSPPGAPTGLPLDKVVHVAVFALATCTLIWAGAAPRLVVIAMLAQAGGSELIQGWWLAGRSGELADVVADCLGIGIGLAMVRWRPRPRQVRSDEWNRPGAPA